MVEGANETETLFHIRGEGIRMDRALCDNFLKFCMVVGMGLTISKTNANELPPPPGGLYAQNSKWLLSVHTSALIW